MYSSLRRNLVVQTAILIGLVLPVCAFASATAQVAISNAPVTAATSTNSQPDAQTVRDRWDASRVEAAAPAANGGAATPASAAPAGSREFAQQYVAEKLGLWQQRLKLNDWRINWAMARRTDLKPNTVGQIHWDRPIDPPLDRCALIGIEAQTGCPSRSLSNSTTRSRIRPSLISFCGVCPANTSSGDDSQSFSFGATT